MGTERSDAQLRLIELNRLFLQEIESGKGWSDVRHLMEEMKVIAKELDHITGTVLQFDNYTLDKTGEQSS